MSGHSHWSTIKHRKEANDAQKGKSYSRLSREILVAIHTGGGSIDPNVNFRLKVAIEKARAADLPKENITRLLDRAKDRAGAMIEVLYEAIAPHGIFLIISSTTDNSNRTHSELSTILEKHGGRMVEKGGAMHLFEKCGMMQFENVTEDSALQYVELVEAYDMDFTDAVCTLFIHFDHISEALHKAKEAGLTEAPTVIYKPTSYAEIGEGEAEKVNSLVSLLEEMDDVQEVFTNMP